MHKYPMQIQSHLATIKNIATAYPEVDAVFMFGSYANNTYNDNSDLDIAVVSKTLSVDQKLFISGILSDLQEPAIDLAYIGDSDLFLAREAVKHFKLVYSKCGFDTVEYYSLILRKYDDFRRYQNVQHQAVRRRLKISEKSSFGTTNSK